jgi:hypothetical protein
MEHLKVQMSPKDFTVFYILAYSGAMTSNSPGTYSPMPVLEKLYIIHDIWNMEQSQFISWQDAQIKFGLLDPKVGD